MATRRPPPVWAAFLSGVVVAAVTITAGHFLVDTSQHANDPPAVLTSDRDAEAFVAAWERMRTGTWAIEATFSRLTASGQTFAAAVEEAQRPPDYVRTSLGGVDARINGRLYACSTLPDGTRTACSDGGPAPEYSDRVKREVRGLREQVLGERRVWDVASLPGNCFRLYLRPARIVPAWGERAEFCFDEVTGAPLKSEYHRESGVDRIVTLRVRAQPTADDFDLPVPPAP